MDVSVWVKNATDAVDHGDAGPSYRCLRELEQLPLTGQESGELNALRAVLRYTAFPVLPTDTAVAVLESQIVHLLECGVDLDDRLSVRYAFTTYGDHERERQAMQKAILSNQEVVAGKTIGVWLREFDKAFDPNTRDNRHIYEFLSNNRQLSERDRTILNLILIAYENWLATERLNIFDLAYLKQHPELVAQAEAGAGQSGAGPYASQAANKAYQENRTAAKPGMGVVKLPLLKAVAEYPRLSEQSITAEKIKLKNQPEPQRPSLANWIHYYRDELGIGFHDQVTRGKFLFQSENGKRLSADERERVNLIVKSIEEETPVDVDTERMQVVFPARVPTTPVSAFPKHPAPLSPARPVKPFQPLPPVNTPVVPPAKTSTEAVKPASPVTEPSFFAKTFGPAKNVANDTLEFSTGHVLPGEKAIASPTRPEAGGEQTARPAAPAPPVAPTPTFNMSGINRNQPQALPRSPYSIRPLRMRGEEKDMDGSE